ncbi:YjzD family protein [Lederbergia graminis]|uniref:YjzD family protein n=1 Tax=Lederbergia graminis TaxID=735518 RepID=A0ABW0LFB6_9BACI|nr:YjzD family protein [Paenibacillus bovis]
MKFVMTAVWGFILTQVLTYVASSMLSIPYDFATGSLLAVGLIVLIILLGAVSSTNTTETH